MENVNVQYNGDRASGKTLRLVRLTYDLTAPFYPLSSRYFHRRAHTRLLELAGSIEGRRVLEVAAGSGELFRRLLEANRSGITVGVDLSPGMMSAVQKSLNGNGHGRKHALHACDARRLPFPDASFEVLMNCYLFELLPDADLDQTAAEFRRVIRPGGRLLLTNVSQSSPRFNFFYKIGGTAIPTFWGRQVASLIPSLIERHGFRVVHRETVKQSGYPTDITVAEPR